MTALPRLTTCLLALALVLPSTAARAWHGDHRGHEGREHEQGDDEERDDEGSGRRGEWQQLAEARERFYATWQGNPWRRARFERWYWHRRRELAGWDDHEERERR